ncbi:MAG: hypothetical protein LBS89_00335 [Zoogloeaceae bacterium]|jgi:hypothetical protein|nr:hypothetical protein [Zoogloeaceae bacterium]
MSTSNRSVVLSRSEVDYLASADFLLPNLLECLQHAVQGQSDTAVALKLSSAVAEEFRDVFTDQLAKVGFDKAYEPTEEGKLLEDLIDRFCFAIVCDENRSSETL